MSSNIIILLPNSVVRLFIESEFDRKSALVIIHTHVSHTLALCIIYNNKFWLILTASSVYHV